MPFTLLAACLALLFGCINLFSAGKSGSLQVIMVFGLLTFIGWFIGVGSVFLFQSNEFFGLFGMISSGIIMGISGLLRKY